MRYTLLFSLLAGLATQAWSAGIRGKVTDNQGTPLPFATVYVQETGSGAATNEVGEYEIRLEPGQYQLVFQYLGYRTVVETVSVGAGFVTLNIALDPQPITIKPVDINLDGEDPAYTVMRKAIAKATYHRQQLDSYQAQVYIKGSGRLIKSPFFVRKLIEKEGIDSTKAFTTESVSIVEYKRPATYKERVISIRTTGDDNDTSPNSYINGSFYEPRLADAVSPLSPQAFAFYRFKLESYFVDRGYGVNKIRVTPRSAGENVFDGYLYIVEDYWAIYSLSLTTYKFGIRFGIDQVYAPIEDKAWLPVSHKFDVYGKILGFAFEYKYLATAKDYRIELNPALDHEFNVVDEKLEKELAEQARQAQKDNPKKASAEDRLAQGGELTRKDLRKLMVEYEKEERENQEEPEVVVNTNFTVDSLAHRRDSSYWEEIRPVPLTTQELRGYRFQDSVYIVQKEKEEVAAAGGELSDKEIKRNSKGKGFKPMDILNGRSYTVPKKFQFSHQSLWEGLMFNPVESFSLHSRLQYRTLGKHPWSVSLTPRYAVARDRFSFIANTYLRGKNQPDNREGISLTGGRYIFQYNPEKPINELLNAYLNLFSERNYIRLYEKEFAQLGYNKRLAENWQLSSSLEWSRRLTLNNRTTQSWFPKENRSYGTNDPGAEELIRPLPTREKALVLDVKLEARPWQKYRIRNGVRNRIEGTSPTLTLQYRRGMGDLFPAKADATEPVSDFDHLDLGFQHNFRVGASGQLDLRLNTGAFLRNDYVGFADFKHFLGNRTSLVTTDPVATYRLLDYYRYSTQDKYFSGFAHYQFRKLLVTQLRSIWTTGLKENVFVNYLSTPTATNYMEVGYSLDNILRFFRLEVAASFEGGKYRDWGILIGVATNLDGLNFSF